MSWSEPPWLMVALRPTYKHGTRFRVCAVCGWPVVSSCIISTLPWSAVTAPRHPPAYRIDDTAMQMSRISRPWSLLQIVVWPTMSPFA